MNSASAAHSVEPAYFGPRERQLLGCYHAPRGQSREHAVLLCYPMGHEYIRCQRAFRRLADQLARAGFATFRFDFLGTGDSAGESDQIELKSWVEDVTLAAQQVRSRSGVRALDVVGLRLGATLGILGDAEVGFDRMVLWQPVLDGAGFVEELRKVHRSFLESQGMSGRGPQEGETVEIMGSPYRAALLRELASVDLRDLPIESGRKVLLIDNAETDGVLEPIAADLRRRGVVIRYESRPEPEIWLAEPFRRLMPHASIRSIVAALSEDWT